MNSREQALKNQVRKAQALIAQFEDGTGRHNSNLAGTDHDAGARINVDTSAFDRVRRQMDELIRQIFSRSTAEAIRLGFIDPDSHTWEEHGVKPRDNLEIHLLNCGLLRARPEDCQIGQVVRLEAIERDPREPWASVVVQIGEAMIHPIEDGSFPSMTQAVNRSEFERVNFCYNHPTLLSEPSVREFWKRVA